jgi:hypothetical protein
MLYHRISSTLTLNDIMLHIQCFKRNLMIYTRAQPELPSPWILDKTFTDVSYVLATQPAHYSPATESQIALVEFEADIDTPSKHTRTEIVAEHPSSSCYSKMAVARPAWQPFRFCASSKRDI